MDDVLIDWKESIDVDYQIHPKYLYLDEQVQYPDSSDTTR